MLTFLDHTGNEFGVLSTFKTTDAVNGERSITGTIHGQLGVERGWKLRHKDEYYAVIFAKPKNAGKKAEVEFDAVHQFFWDFDKSSVYTEMDGSHQFTEYLDFIFNGSGYRYNLEVEVGSLRKQNFGLKKRLELFYDLVKHAGVEFQVRGRVVRILEKTGTDLSTVVRRKLNLQDLTIEKNIGNFVTYVKGLGAWKDEQDKTKGRLEVEYISPLALSYGRLEAEPYIDERFTNADNFKQVLKKRVEDSYTISVQLTMEDLNKAGYRYTQPTAGDYITVIDEDNKFKEKVRIVSFETEYDVKGQVVDHKVTCNDIGSVKKQVAGYNVLKNNVANVSKDTESALKVANRALVSADGKSTVYFGTEFPQDVPKGTLTKGDTLYLTVGDTTKMYYWNGAEWIEPPVVNDVERFKRDLAEEIAQVNTTMQAQSEEHDRQVADILSKTQFVESLANQAKSDAANAIARANQVKTEAIADARAQVATVSQALNAAKTELQSAIASADQKARDSQASATALRNELNVQASKILAQAQAQTALTNRVSTVETLADGTRSTVAELSKTVSKATGDITSVTSRTKTVEDTLSQTRTQYEALTQTVNNQTGQIESINRKTADLQSGIDGVTERFENLQVGGENLLLNAGFENAVDRAETFTVAGVTYKNKSLPHWGNLYNGGIQNPTTSFHAIFQENFEGIGPVIEFNESDGSRNWKAIDARLRPSDIKEGNYTFSTDVYATGTGTKIWFGFYYYNKSGVRNFHSGLTTVKVAMVNSWHRISGSIKLKNDIDLTKDIQFYIYAYNFESNSILYLTKPKLENGTVATAFSLAQETIRSEIAKYRRTADQNYAGLQSTVSTLDGKITQNKTEANQTATQLSNRLTSLETYKDGESTRAQAYFEASKTETAKQIVAERTAIANNYVAKSTYDENVRGTTLKLNEIKTTADTAKQNLATYQNTVDRKLEELTSSTQTLDGKINTASAKVDTVAGQIRTEISEVEGKIPTENGGTNLIIGSMTRLPMPYRQSNLIFTKNQSVQEWQATDAVRVQGTKGSSNIFCFLSVGQSNYKPTSGVKYVHSIYIKNIGAPFQVSNNLRKTIDIATGETKRVVILDVATGASYLQINFQQLGTGQLDFYYWHPQIETGTIVNDWSPAPEDLINELSSVKTTITQTASGVEQLSTSLATTDSKVTTAETKIRNLVDEVSSKVSQTDYNTLTGRVDSAETAITQNATEISKRLTKTQVDKAITDKGYQTKSDVDSNITGRGYITNSALQPYALSTTVQNLVEETADSFSRTISEAKALIPKEAGAINLILDYENKTISTYNSPQNVIKQDDVAVLEWDTTKAHRISLTTTATGTFGYISSGRTAEMGHRYYFDGSQYTGSIYIKNLNATAFRVSINASKTVTIEPNQTTRVILTDAPSGQRFLQFNFLSDTANEKIDFIYWHPQIEQGSLATAAGPALEDLATVTALHNVTDTVDSHTRTIGAVGEIGSILDNVSKVTQTAAGLVQEVSGTNGLKTQVSTLAGSYAVKNLTSTGNVLNQLNLNKDGSVKLDGSLVQITGKTYIEDGVIKNAMIGELDAGKITTGYLASARIATNSITGSHMVFDQAFVNKMTANEALFKQLFAQSAFITSVQAVAVSAKQIAGGIAKALNGGMDVNFDESKINFYTNVAAIRRIYTGHPTQFIKFETKGNYSRTIIGSNRNGGEVFNSATFAGVVVENTNNINTEDGVRIYGDNTLLRHARGDVGWNINSVTQRIVPANINAESEIWSKHFVAPDKNSKPVRLDTAVAALWDIWNHIIYNNFEFNEALRTHIKARRDNWKFELNL
ncbi:TPA: phage tail protein [Streptococcus suis]|nr:phage tail protein [Streptococcus suis]